MHVPLCAAICKAVSVSPRHFLRPVRFPKLRVAETDRRLPASLPASGQRDAYTVSVEHLFELFCHDLEEEA